MDSDDGLFDVYVAGFEVEQARAARGLMRIFGLNETAARIFVQSVPRMGKRRISREAAERYATALRAIGALVDCRPSEAKSTTPGPLRAITGSLPVPGTLASQYSMPPHHSTPSSGQPQPSAAYADPAQLRAPRVPPDAQRMSPFPAAADGGGQEYDLFEQPDAFDPRQGYLEQARMQTQAQAYVPAFNSPLPQAMAFDPTNPDAFSAGSEPAPTFLPGVPGVHSTLPPDRDSSLRPIRPEAVGSIHPYGAYSSTKPNASPTTARPSKKEARPFYKHNVARVLMAALLAVAGFAAYRSRVFETEQSRRERNWSESGIRYGHYEPAQPFLSDPHSHFEGLPPGRASDLVDGVTRAGALKAWVIDVHEVGSQRMSSSLLVELPNDAAQRRTIFWQHVRGVVRKPVDDTGQRYLELDF